MVDRHKSGHAFPTMAAINCYVGGDVVKNELTENNFKPPGGLVTFMDIPSLRDVKFVRTINR
jgi:hypothetical protein